MKLHTPALGKLGARLKQPSDLPTQDSKDRRKMYGTAAWQKLRASYLRAHPFCAHCLDKEQYTPATEVDHVVPHRGDWRLFLRRENLQALCKPCHSRKTLEENGGMGAAKWNKQDRF